MHTATLTLADDGTLALPADLLRAAGLSAGDSLVVECDSFSLLVRPLDPADDRLAAPAIRG